ncbi:hemoglobin subunit beta [Neocloeon triangulifer]|uniref:hemoglobin subunit beta n=1 Tax=Neocloeon triangulifer TaxID=2078957 RepID=UPI00286ED809|nr:hemoglobin subunit beta [Neocloeon triangulifer]
MAGLLDSLLGMLGLGQKDLDVEDPATGLTLRQKNHVRSTWALVVPNIKSVGVDLLTTFFVMYPHHQKLFPAFANLSVEDLRKNKKFTAHCSNVMFSLTGLVDGLDDTEVLVELCAKIGNSHARHHVPPQAFDDLKVAALKVLSEKLGKKLTPSAADAWDKTLTVAFSVIKKELTEQ